MKLKRVVAAVVLVLAAAGTGAGLAQGHDSAGTEGIWPMLSPSMTSPDSPVE